MTLKFDAIIFDIDNVLIDTRASYTDCIIKTVTTYLETVLKFQSSRKSFLSRKDIEIFKSLGGFNDDWDTCYGLLLYFLNLKIRKRTINELVRQKDIGQLIRFTKNKPLGIIGLSRLLRWINRCSRPCAEHFSGRTRRSSPKVPAPEVQAAVRHSINRRRFAPRNDVPKGTAKNAVIARQQSNQGQSNLQAQVNIKNIADIFQRFYLSDFVWNESLIIPNSFLKQLKKNGLKLGIVTGRNREEANFALRRFQIDRYFDTMITVDETPAKFKKPHPYGLIKVAARLGKKLNYLYIGDLPDDILAAKQAKKKLKISSCGFLKTSSQLDEMKREFKKLKVDFICEDVKELKEILNL